MILSGKALETPSHCHKFPFKHFFHCFVSFLSHFAPQILMQTISSRRSSVALGASALKVGVPAVPGSSRVPS